MFKKIKELWNKSDFDYIREQEFEAWKEVSKNTLLDLLSLFKKNGVSEIKLGVQYGFVTKWENIHLEEIRVVNNYPKQLIYIKEYEFNLFHNVGSCSIVWTDAYNLQITIDNNIAGGASDSVVIPRAYVKFKVALSVDRNTYFTSVNQK